VTADRYLSGERPGEVDDPQAPEGSGNAEARAERIRQQFRLSRFLAAVRDAVAKAK
jgi:hypothetical protein